MKAFSVLFCFLLSANTFAASYFVSDVRTSDSDPNLAASVKTLVTSAVTSAGATVAETEAQANFTLRSELVKLGQAYVLTVTKIKGGSAIYVSKQKAANVEELDDASDRAVRAAILDTPTKKDTRVGEVKQRDENQLRTRINSHNTTLVAFGAAGLQNMGNNKIAYDLTLGHNWEVTPRAQIRLLGDLIASSDWSTYYADAQLGLNLLLTDEDSSPYLGVGFGFGGSGSGSSSATTLGGFSGGLGVGYQFFRTSSTQFDVYGGYLLMFVNNTIGTPGAYALRIGVMY